MKAIDLALDAIAESEDDHFIIFSHPPKRRRVTYASTIRPASASTLSTSMKPLHGIISYCTCILV